MLPYDAELNEETLRRVLSSGHSRVPVHAPGNRQVCTLAAGDRVPCHLSSEWLLE